MTATTEVRTDLKAGYCGRCRQGDHALCASPVGRCSCTGKAHPNRPPARPQEVPVPAAAARPIAAVPSPVVQWEDPPDPKRGNPGLKFAPELLRELEANPGRWARVDSLTSKSAASSRLTAFRKGTYKPVTPPQWEAAARRTATGSAFYLRYVGAEA